MVVVIDRKKTRIVYSLNNGELFRDLPFDFRIKKLIHCNELIVIWTRDNVVVVVKPPQIINRFSIKTDRAMCLWASSQYNRVVVGTRSGRLCFYTLYGSRFMTAVELDGWIPLKVIVTAGFGLVVVAFHGKLAVFTINGVKIREREFPHIVTEWCSFVNRRGFDFVILNTSEGRVLVVEVFFLKEGPTLFQSHPPVAVLKYDQSRWAFAVATPDGCGHIVPCEAVESVLKCD
jgi:hypothetical protein